jgi:oxygen-dependent protoporphyrinogen oxidase
VNASKVIVAGGGLSGLACAFDLARAGADVVLLEADDRVGGVVGTIERDGFQFETGPNTIQASSAAFRRLCGDLAIADRLIASSPAADRRYVFLEGRLRALPSTPRAFLTSDVLSLGARVRVCSELVRRWKPPAPGAPEPDLQTFFTERLGAEATRVLAGAFVRGVYASELADLGARSAFPRMWRACAEHGGLVRGLRAAARRPKERLPGPDVPPSALLSFPRGLREIVDALAGSLGDRVRTRTRVEKLERTGAGYAVRTDAGERIETARLVLAVPAPAAAALLAPLSDGVPIDHLRAVRHASVTLVHLGLAASEAPRLPDGFGYLVPPERAARASASPKRPRALGTIFVSNLFSGRAPEGCAAVSSFYTSSEVMSLDERGLVALACDDLALVTGELWKPRARVSDIRRWKDAIPCYAPGHADRMAELDRAVSARLPSLHLAGSYLAGVSVDQVITRGRATAEEILR